MLPVNFMSEKEAEIFKSHGVPAENILAAIRFDLDTNGNFGITWLAIKKKRKRLCRLDENNNLYSCQFTFLRMRLLPFLSHIF